MVKAGRLFAIVMLVVFVFGLCNIYGIPRALAQEGKIIVNMNGQELDFKDQGPIIVNNRILVPIRDLFEAFGATIEWMASSQTVIATRGATKISIVIGSRSASINETKRLLDVPAQVINDKTMIPLRFVGEALGTKVEWIDTTQVVLITSIPQQDRVADQSSTNSSNGTSTVSKPSDKVVGGKLAIAGVKASAEESANPASHSYDGKKDTRWVAMDQQSITYDLGTVKKVSGVKIAWYKGDDRNYNFSMEVSNDNAAWTAVIPAIKSREMTSEFQSYGFKEAPARYIRYTGTGSSVNPYNAIAEIEIYGE